MTNDELNKELTVHTDGLMIHERIISELKEQLMIREESSNKASMAINLINTVLRGRENNENEIECKEI